MDDQFDTFLAGYSSQVGEISKTLRTIIREAAPGSKEELFLDQKHLSYSANGTPEDQIIFLAPKKDYVFLVFKQCKNLSDPEGLLGGAGKQSRFMTVRTVEDASKPEMKKLIQSVWENAAKQTT